jgi:intracellular septation protein
MIAILLAMIVSLIRYRRVSPMTWLSAVLVIGFGGLTLWLHEERFIQMKPTAIYAGLGGLLAIGLLRGKPLLRPLLGQIFPGLTHRGWMLLSRNWAIFFIALALINEAMREFLSFDAWLTLKVWGVTAVTLIFSAANMPMLLRHGLDPEKTSPVAQAPPNQ